jgi:hypothetical protein
VNPVRAVRYLTRAASLAIAALCTFAACATPAYAQVIAGAVSSTSPINRTVTIKLADSVPASLVRGVPISLSIAHVLITLIDTVRKDSTLTILRIDTVRKDSTVVIVNPPPKDTTPSPTDTTTKPPSAAGTVLASVNFDNGSYGAMSTDAPAHDSIVVDPTNSGHGKVLRVTYACGGGQPACVVPPNTVADLNQYLWYLPANGGVAHGQTICVNADMYVPPDTPRWTDGLVLRKLTYFWLTGHQASVVVGSGGTNSNIYGTDTQNGAGVKSQFVMQAGVWTHMQIQLTMNSTPGAKDGVFKLWINGKLVGNMTGLAYTNAGASTSTKMQTLAFGYQREGAPGEASILEYHYWDNFVFSTACQ